MDCLSFRRSILTEPHRCDRLLAAHAAECPTCASYRVALLRQERELEETLAIAVPDYLSARVLVRQSSRSTTIGTWRIGAVLVACAVLSLAIGLRVMDGATPNAHLALEHLIDHPALTPLDDANALVEVNNILHDLHVVLGPDFGSLAAAEACVIGGRLAAHLVVDSDSGPLDVLIMPDTPLQREITFSAANMAGLMMPCPRGSVAIIGAADAPLKAIWRGLEQKISFI